MWLSRSDLHYTLRQMGRKPGFVLLAALVLAGGLSVSLIAFSVSYSFSGKPLPITNGERIVHICPYPSDRDCSPMPADDFARIRGEISTLSNVGAYQERYGVLVEYEGESWPDRVIETEWNLFQLSGSQAALGRTLQPEDHAAGAESVAVLGHRLWQQRFGGDPGIVGRTFSIDRAPVRVVGVMPEGYAMPYSAQLWRPLRAQVLAPLDGPVPMPLVESFALLEPGVSVTQANAEINALMERNRAQHPRDPFAEYPSRYLRYLHEAATGHVAHFPTALLGGVGTGILLGLMNAITLLIFLLGCINVSTLLLARINERTKDTAIRVALGASRSRLLLQLCLEGALITVLGAALAVLLAGIGMELVTLIARSLDEGLLPFWLYLGIDATTLAGVVFYVALSILLTSVLPGWRVINGDFNAAMQDGSRGALGLRPGRFSRSLVVAALTIVTLLLYLVALLGSSIVPLSNTLAKVPDSLVNARFVLDEQRYDETQRQQFVRTLLARLEAEGGIQTANVTAMLGRSGVEAEGAVSPPGEAPEASLMSESLSTQRTPSAELAVRANDAMTPRLLEGRRFTEADGANGERVVMISQSLAQRLWPGESPLDKRLRVLGSSSVGGDWRRVVGLFSDGASGSFLSDLRREHVVLPLAQVNTTGVPFDLSAFATSAAGKPRLLQGLQEAFAALDSGLLPQVRDPALVLDSVAGAFGMGIRAGLVVAAFVFMVAIAGIYGLTQNAVLMATHEIGVRRALGARDGLIARLFMKRSARQVLIGFAVAMLVCAPVTWLFSMLADELELDFPLSMLVAAVVIGILYCAVMLATYLPVRRILRLEPSEALRHE